MSAVALRVAPIQAETILYAVAIAGGLYLLYRAVNGAGEVIADVGEALNPFNNDNVINTTFTDYYRMITGSTGTLGTDIYDLTHVDPSIKPDKTVQVLPLSKPKQTKGLSPFYL